MLDDSELSRPQHDDVDVDQSFSMYDTVLRNVASIGAADSCASKTKLFDSIVRRLVSCQKARVSDVGAPLRSNTQRHRLSCLGQFNTQPTQKQGGVLA